MRAATFNVLADAYLSYGDYSHVTPSLLESGARIPGIVRTIDELDADIIGLQEAEAPLVNALEETGNWQTFWTPKGHNKRDGCVTLVKPDIKVNTFESHEYSDGTGHIMQILEIGRIAFANTHIKWAPEDAVTHVGVGQVRELLDVLGPDRPAVIFADSNDRPHGHVRQLVDNAGFSDIVGEMPTAMVNGQAVPIDILAVRGLAATRLPSHYNVLAVPNESCPSDHIPIVAELEIN